MKKALVIGAGGQQGSYLCELLLEKNYQVHGIIRQNDFPVCQSEGAIEYHFCEMNDDLKIFEIISIVKPHEIYNLAAINSIDFSFENPIATMDINFCGLVRIAEVIRRFRWDCKIYFASSSEVFGNPIESPQTEGTKPNPRNPYGISKLAGWNYAKICREKYGIKIYVGIIYNNDSPRRPEEFLTRKVCKYVASVANGNKEKLKLGNLNARRDFGYAKEYAEWAWRIMQHPTAQDFILATGVTHSAGDFVAAAFDYAGIPNWGNYIEVDQSLFRPSETNELVGSASKSKYLLGFEPKVSFNELVSIMMEHELNQYKK